MLANNKRIPSSIYKTHKQIQFVDECSKFMNQIFYRNQIFIFENKKSDINNILETKITK